MIPLTLRRSAAVAAVTALTAPAGLSAQGDLRFAAGLTGAYVWVHSDGAGTSEALKAPGFGVKADLVWWRLGLDLRYLQADLKPTTTDALRRDMTEGRALLGLQLTSWLDLATGPQVRSYGTAVGTQRWFLWAVAARGESALLPNIVRGYAEFWTVFPVNVNVPEQWNDGFGGEVGVTLALSHLPLWLRLAYRLEVYRLGDGARRETVDAVTLDLGIGRRR